MNAGRRPIEDRLELALAQTAVGLLPDDAVPPAAPVVRDARPVLSRRTTPLLAAAAVVLAVLGGVAVNSALQRHHKSAPQPPSHHSPRPAPIDPRSARLRNAIIDIPVWDKYDRGACPAGPHKFTNGVARAGSQYGNRGTYVLWVPPEPQYEHYGQPIFGNIDGKSANEVLVELSCQAGNLHVYELLALAPREDGAYRALGVVNYPTNDGGFMAYMAFDTATVRLSERTILLDVQGPQTSNGGPLAMEQTRGYRYLNGRFVQVSGPRTFPRIPTNVHDIDLRNATELLDNPVPWGSCDNCYSYLVRFVNGRAHVVIPAQVADGTYTLSTQDYVIDAITYLGHGHGVPDLALVTVTRRVDGGAPEQIVYAIGGTDGEQIGGGSPVVWTGYDGVTSIGQVRGADGIATVIVGTAHGEQTRTYMAVDGNVQHWVRTAR